MSLLTKKPLLKDAKAEPRVPLNPEVLIAGSVPVGNAGVPLEPAWHALAMSLGTDHVRLVFARHENRVYYVGAREQEFDGAGLYTTRLAAGLPGHPDFKGDGAYLDTSGATPAVLLVQGDVLSARTGARENLERLARAKGLDIHELDETHSQVWETVSALAARSAWKRLSAATWVGVGAYVLGLVFGGIALWDLSQARSLEEQSRQATDVLRNQLATELGRAVGNPLAEQLAQMHRVQTVALENGGTLHYWKIDAKGTSFQLTLPAYVRSEDFKALGPLTSVQKQQGVVVLTRGEAPKK